MTAQHLVDTALGRGVGVPPPRPPEVPARRRDRRRRSHARGAVIGAFALVACVLGLWVAWQFVRERPRTEPSRPVDLARIGAGDACVERGSSVTCAIPNGQVTYAFPTDVVDAYRRVAGADDGVAGRGEPACARGESEERAWSRPRAPAVEAGRYLCRRVGGRAEMWWTDLSAGVLAHATRDDGDLGALFAWWRDHP